MGKASISGMIGARFGRLLVVAAAGRSDHGALQWLCMCDCGRNKIARGISLRDGGTRSCGCLRSERAARHMRAVARKQRGGANPAYKHGHKVGGKESPELRSYRAAKERCENPGHVAYARYGGRGIEFRFESFAEFLAVLGRKPTPRHTIERLDNDGHYELGNVCWATYAEQNRNKRSAA